MSFEILHEQEIDHLGSPFNMVWVKFVDDGTHYWTFPLKCEGDCNQVITDRYAELLQAAKDANLSFDDIPYHIRKDLTP
jgi:hypothetical protein